MVITAASTIETVQSVFPQAIVETVEFRDEQTLVLKPEHLVEVCAYLKQELHYAFLETVTAVDWPERVPRFDVVYHILSLTHRCYIRLKTRVGQRREEHPTVPSVTGIWPAANWYEREVFDLFGLTFSNHPDLRRIMMPPEWTTHPLRKDYPLTGFELPEPHWGGQVPYTTDPGVGDYYQQTLRTSDGRGLNEKRQQVNSEQEPGTFARSAEDDTSATSSTTRSRTQAQSQDGTRKG
ncbi:NADH-quinone oxidoreductase subunit C [Dictyobacter arantiisoli]|uniref:NADH-quinone oxidoreductase subunit C n=1 Tax=Dictyobacter arantiisoli TaxID=2014874 RepID=A0A5A5T6D4_9CHLR|nr:NADH-quinone oxidoreductase subunit C [Dictyobacter arantiisoli]GCF06746.1 hypothetical protein KDI_03100 [Dictyobacter arantiisoli]